MDTCTSLLAGTIIFGILGNLAFKMNVDVSEVVKSGGTGLAFISYPEAIARFDHVPWVSFSQASSQQSLMMKNGNVFFKYQPCMQNVAYRNVNGVSSLF